MKKAVFTIITLRTSGVCGWWDEFPMAISENLASIGVDHHCFYRAYEDCSPHSKASRHILTHEAVKNVQQLQKALNPWIDKYEKVILHYHTFKFPSAFWKYHNRFNKKTHWMITDHDLWEHKEFSAFKRGVRKIIRSLGMLPEKIVGCSQASKNRLQGIYGIRNVDFIYNGIDLKKIPNPEPISDIPSRALFAGRLESIKGLWPMVKAVELLKGQTPIHLNILGRGPLFEPLEKYIKEKNLEGFISLVGFTRDVDKYYRESHFSFIQTLLEENCPISALEALAWGLPSIYTNSGGLPEIEDKYKTGIMVPKNDPEKIAEAIKYLQNDVGRFNEMRVNARQQANKFDIHRMAQEYVNIYEEVFRS